eukprot:3088486-Rhodomonas_salina.2
MCSAHEEVHRGIVREGRSCRRECDQGGMLMEGWKKEKRREQRKMEEKRGVRARRAGGGGLRHRL